MFNRVHSTEKIPKSWLEGRVIRLYKGKGTRGMCCNERGITLSSNIGKVFERLIDNRIKNTIKMTSSQAGGIAGKATSDHIIILNTIIKQNKRRKESTHIVFLDVTKAYDKAWLDALLYAANNAGIEGKNLRLMKNLNTGITATIATKSDTDRR